MAETYTRKQLEGLTGAELKAILVGFNTSAGEKVVYVSGSKLAMLERILDHQRQSKRKKSPTKAKAKAKARGKPKSMTKPKVRVPVLPESIEKEKEKEPEVEENKKTTVMIFPGTDLEIPITTERRVSSPKILPPSSMPASPSRRTLGSPSSRSPRRLQLRFPVES